jgi:leucyl/phenylalanyl-tRNA--protein transferase
VGGDLSPERLLVAYDQGIFPWYDDGYPPLWWSPDPRTVLDPETLHVSRSLARALRRGGFELSWNRDFGRVMVECGRRRPGGTWIFPEMLDAYERLHQLGHAHSLEVWAKGDLVGGIYGVQRGGLFAAESMFHRRTNASKVALVAAVQSLFLAGIRLFDVQFLTPHLGSLGAREIPRAQYLERLGAVREHRVDLGRLVPKV